MEAQQHNHFRHHYGQQQEVREMGNNNMNSYNKHESSMCRQSSKRWTPTTEQVRQLRELYYNKGVRSPSTEQIQKITAQLRQYGKIEGKNVFYWFQNHKARERLKFNITTGTNPTSSAHAHHQLKHNSITSSFHPNADSAAAANWRSSQIIDHSVFYNNDNNTSGVVPCPSLPAGMTPAVNHIGTYANGPVATEKGLQVCSISPNNSTGGSLGQNPEFHYVPCSYPFLGQIKLSNDDNDNHTLEEEDDESPELETLPLFPICAEDSTGYYTTTSTSGCYRPNVDGSIFSGSRASLELTLNSYINSSRRSGLPYY